MQEGYISLREFSRRYPVSLKAIQKAIAAGRVTDVLRKDDGTLCGIHAMHAWAEWHTNTDPGQAAKSGKVYAPVEGGQPDLGLAEAGDVAQQVGATQSEPSAHTEPGYADHRTKREKFLAEQAELDYLEKVGSLVWARDVERESLEIFKQVRANVLRSNSKIAVLIAAETDPAKVERLLNDSDNRVFDELSRTFADGQAEGTEERAPALP